ncbi:MAG: DUF4250 domain-containing protein [Muribaculaceae bacterium]|nr:DUF4250 domain-containing protein [Muribaculaceae bacterium]
MDLLPKDPAMLVSFINMKLRDEYRTLEDFCAVYGLDESKLKSQLEAEGFDWKPDCRQFR